MEINEEDWDPNCVQCTDGINHHFFKDVKDKLVLSEWSYCLHCFPNSSCTIHGNNNSNFEAIDIDQFNSLYELGWRDFTGFY